MTAENRATITLDADVRDQLNRARKDRGQTWTAYLRDAALALERPVETVTAAQLTPGTVEDLSLTVARAVRKELESAQGAPW